MRTTRAITFLVVGALIAPAILSGHGTASGLWPQFRRDDQHAATADAIGGIRAPLTRNAVEPGGAVLSSPAVADVDGERLIVFGSYVGLNQAGSVYAARSDGSIAWSTSPLGSSGGYVSSPTVEDIDGDGHLDVVIASLDDSTLRSFDAATGAQTWARQVGQSTSDLIGSSPLVADLVPGSPGLEIAIGGSRPGDAGNLLIYDAAGALLQSIVLDGPSWSTPLLVDADGDGQDELALATGVPETIQLLFPSAKTGGGSLYVFHRAGDAWSVKWSAGLGGPTLASPAAGDLDGDGSMELVVGAQGGRVSVFDGTTGVLEATSTGWSDVISVSSPTVVDVDADGVLEIVTGTWDGVFSLEHAGGALVLDDRLRLPAVPDGNGGQADPWVAASVAIGDVNADGVLDVVGMTVPVLVDTNDLLNSQALPGTVFAVNGTNLDHATGLLWAVQLPNDGGIGGPVIADADGDGWTEVIAGEGLPLIGDGRRLHVLAAANPIVRSITVTPEAPTDLDEVVLHADVLDEDTDEAELAFAWDLGDGTVFQGREPTHTFPDDGTYDVSLTVADPAGHEWTRSVTIVVANVPPTAGPEAETVAGRLDATFDVVAGDADGVVSSIEWDLGDGTTAVGTALAHTYATGGRYPVTVTVTDDDGDATVEVLQVDVNRFPEIDGPTSALGREGELIELRAAVTDPDGDAVEVTEVTGAPGAEVTIQGGEAIFRWTPGFDRAGRHAVQLTVVDAGSPSGSVSHEFAVDVWDVNRAPVIGEPDAATVKAGRTGVFTGTVSDPDDDELTIAATELPEGSVFQVTRDGWHVEFPTTLDMAGTTHSIGLAVTDGNLTTTRSVPVTVTPNAPPVAVAATVPTVNVSTAWAPEAARLDGSSSHDVDGDGIASWTWTVEDVVHNGAIVDHTFASRGVHEATLEVVDGAGATANATVPILVDDALEGTIDLYEVGGGPWKRVHVVVWVTRDDGTPLSDHRLDVSVVHDGLGVETATAEVGTTAAGIAAFVLDGDFGLKAFVPGTHTISVSTTADSAPGAVIDDIESLVMTASFDVRP